MKKFVTNKEMSLSTIAGSNGGRHLSRLLAVFSAVCLFFALLPAAVFAEETDPWDLKNAEGVTLEGSYVEGKYEISEDTTLVEVKLTAILRDNTVALDLAQLQEAALVFEVKELDNPDISFTVAFDKEYFASTATFPQSNVYQFFPEKGYDPKTFPAPYCTMKLPVGRYSMRLANLKELNQEVSGDGSYFKDSTSSSTFAVSDSKFSQPMLCAQVYCMPAVQSGKFSVSARIEGLEAGDQVPDTLHFYVDRGEKTPSKWEDGSITPGTKEVYGSYPNQFLYAIWGDREQALENGLGEKYELTIDTLVDGVPSENGQFRLGVNDAVTELELVYRYTPKVQEKPEDPTTSEPDEPTTSTPTQSNGNVFYNPPVGNLETDFPETAVIADEETPLAGAPDLAEAEDGPIVIDEEETPLGKLPTTGAAADARPLWAVGALLLGAATVVLMWAGRKKHS